MGILADFFVATPEDALRYSNRISEADEGESLDALLQPASYNGVTNLELGTLWAILERAPFDDARHVPEDDLADDDGESWLFRFPDELTALIAAASPEELKRAGEEWARSDELDCEPDLLSPLLADLQRLSKLARSNGKAVYLWGCV